MKGTGKIILSTLLLTILALGYVHGQNAAIQLSYHINHKGDLLAEKTEFYRHLKYDVDQLKAPRLLEAKIDQLSLNLDVPREIRVIQVPPQLVHSIIDQPDLTVTPSNNRFGSFLGRWIGVAQAKTEQ